MFKPMLTVTALALTCVALDACSAKRSNLDLQPGHYETSTSSTRSNGTNVEQTDSTTVGYDDYGNKRAVTKSTTTQDPPGLLNKSTRQTTTVEER